MSAEPASPETSRVDLSKLPPLPENGSPFPAEWAIALSHLRSKKSEAFLNLVTVLSILGVVAGVAILNWVIGVMSGFEVELRDQILGANAHIITRRYTGYVVDGAHLADVVADVPGVRAAAPFVYGEALARTPGHEGGGVVFKGIDPERHGGVTSLLETLEFGLDDQGYAVALDTDEARLAAYNSVAEPIPAPSWTEGGRPLMGIIIGRELATGLDVGPGDVVTLINPAGGAPGPMGMPVPALAQFRVAATYYSGMIEYDSKWTYAHNSASQAFYKRGDAWDGLEVAVDRVDDADHVAERIDEALGFPFYSTPWMHSYAKLFGALRLEKWVMGLILSMITFVAALLIVTTLIMLVITKAREIAILKAMGASRRSVMRMFVMEGSLIGFVGTAIGTALGVGGCFFLRWYGWPLDTEVYYLSELPVVIDPINFVFIAVGAFAMCFFATLYPAYKAASVDPVEGLRYE